MGERIHFNALPGQVRSDGGPPMSDDLDARAGTHYLDANDDLKPEVTIEDLLFWVNGILRHSGPVTVQAAMVHGLAAAVRSLQADHDTALDVIGRFREKAEAVAAVPFGAYWRWHESGSTDAAERMSDWEASRKELRALYDHPAVLAAAETRRTQDTGA